MSEKSLLCWQKKKRNSIYSLKHCQLKELLKNDVEILLGNNLLVNMQHRSFLQDLKIEMDNTFDKAFV